MAALLEILEEEENNDGDTYTSSNSHRSAQDNSMAALLEILEEDDEDDSFDFNAETSVSARTTAAQTEIDAVIVRYRGSANLDEGYFSYEFGVGGLIVRLGLEDGQFTIDEGIGRTLSTPGVRIGIVEIDEGIHGSVEVGYTATFDEDGVVGSVYARGRIGAELPGGEDINVQARVEVPVSEADYPAWLVGDSDEPEPSVNTLFEDWPFDPTDPGAPPPDTASENFLQ